ncbi:MAG: 3-dehydro-L-gulonate 2-dehydrogenase [Bacteroidota bacterium]|nr:3-dehydro-L-gulonate 2-dehydrogenase [Bacteroidota bacterium]
MAKSDFIMVTAHEMQSQFMSILMKYGFNKTTALQCAEIFTTNSVDGVYSHGVNRFPVFVQYAKEKWIKPDAIPSLKKSFGGIEQWDGQSGPGPLNAVYSTNRCMQLAQQNGIGCIALSNTNHWMRGGTYGWKAAKEGFVFLAWTNTIANMPAWNALDSRLGNNPLVIALPYKDEAIVLDMAMSQYSFGAMEMAVLKNEKLPVFGGYDAEGNLTNDPSAIIQSRRPLPIGYWKGAGLSLLLDILAAILSGGLSTHEVSKQQAEYGLSQVFICIDLSKLNNHSLIAATIDNILNDYKQSTPVNEKEKIFYPGEKVLATRKKNLQDGIPVLKNIWDKVLAL